MEFQFTLIDSESNFNGWHEGLEVIYILDGRGVVFGNERHDSYAVQTSDIFVVNPYQIYRLEMEPGCKALSLLLSPTFLMTFCSEIYEIDVDCKSYAAPLEQREIYDVIRGDLADVFIAKCKTKSPNYSIQLRSESVILIRDLVSQFGKQRKKNTTVSLTSIEHLHVATKYIHANYNREISLSELAAHTNLSATSLSHLFRKQLNRTFSSYLSDIRLTHAEALLKSEHTVTEIAYETGFSNTNAFIEAFKQKYNDTPGQYRRALSDNAPTYSTAFDGDYSTLITGLLSYADQQKQKILPSEPFETLELCIDTTRKVHTLKHNWRKLINLGYANDLRSGALQQQLGQMQREIGFIYGRVKGILDDDMMLCLKDSSGKLVYNYVYIDEMIDFMLSIGLIPYIELSHMPSAIAESQIIQLRRSSIISLPSSLDVWIELIKKLMNHFIARYGIINVRKWIISPLFSLHFADFLSLPADKYLELYIATTKTIREIDPQIIISGPGYGLQALDKIEAFLKDIRIRQYLPDILALREYYSVKPNEEEGPELILVAEGMPSAVSGDEHKLKQNLQQLEELLCKMGLDNIPVWLDEWSSNGWQRDLCNDTSYKSAFFFKEVLENYDRFGAMGYWSVSDLMSETLPSDRTFHGGFGLMTRSGLPKSGYRALQLLRHAGHHLLTDGKGYLITASDDEIQIFLYNYAHYNTLYRYRHTNNITQTDRYNVFNESRPCQFHIRMLGMKANVYTEQRYYIGPSGGSVYDEWIKIGASEPITKYEFDYLLRHSHPIYTRKQNETAESCVLNATLKPHEILLITIQTQG